MKRLNVSVFCLFAFISVVSADVVLSFKAGGNDAPSTLVTLSNLSGAVSSSATATSAPIVNPSNNRFTKSNGSGSIKATFTALGNSSSNFNPRKWTGGTPTNIQATNVGWGIIGDINGNIQGTEALLIKFDLSSANLGSGNKLVWTDADLDIDGSGKMVIWRKRANESAGQLVSAANSGLSRSITIEDGDTFALIEASSTARFVSMTLDIVNDTPWNSNAVFKDTDGRLAYAADVDGNRIMDFSHAGYKAGEAAIPNVSVVKTISPISGDDTAHIQSAINEVAAMPLVNGRRGALLLRAGTYQVSGIVYLNADGIVLRGEGQGSNPANDTIILATGTNSMKEQGTIMVKSNIGLNPVAGGTRQNVTSDFIPAGSRTIEVEDGSQFNIGDYLVIEHNSNHEWLLTVNYGNIYGDSVQWSDENSRQNMTFHGTVIAIDGNQVKLDTPIYHPLVRSNTQATVYRHSGIGIVEGCGVENLRVAVQSQGGTDENHRWDCIHFYGARNSWVKNCTAIGFAESGFRFSRSARCTAIDCSAIEPVAQIAGGRRYNFYMGEDTHDILVKRCYASYGRHDFVGNGAAATNGIVFTQSTSEFTYSSSENHLRWGSAFLWDNNQWNFPNTGGSVLSLYNRGNSGTSHGWTGTNFVAWNNNTWKGPIVCSEPPLGQNYAIGNNSTVFGSNYPLGFVQAATDDMQYPSLYEAQLNERLTHGIGPDMPANFRSTHFENNASPFIVLEWTDIGLAETAYVVERSTNGGNSYTTLATIAANSESYTDATVANNGNYTYRISATNANGRSAYSNPVKVNLTSTEAPDATTYHFLENNTTLSGCSLQWDKHNYSGKYFINMGAQSTWFQIDVDGGRGGPTLVAIRYALSNSGANPCNFYANGSLAGQATLNSTGSWDNWATEVVTLNLQPGINTLRMQPATGAGGPNIDRFDIRPTPAIYAAGESKNRTATRAFDQNANTSWRHESPYGSWIEQSFDNQQAFNSYGLTSSIGAAANDPAAWQLMGSNNGGNSWTILDSRSGQSFSSRGQTKTYSVSNSGSYSLYRLMISAVKDLPNADSVQLAELSFGFTTNPVVSFVNPPSTLNAGSNLQFEVNASDADGINRVYLYKDGVQLTRTEGGAPYEWGLENQNDPELQNLAAGVYEFRAVARDNAGNEGEATITVTVNPVADTVKPVVSFDAAPTSLFAGDNLELTVNASDANGISIVRLYKDGVQLVRTEGGAPYNFGQPGQNDTELENLAVGVYEFRAVAEDPSGNQSETTIVVTVVPIPDTVKPVVNFILPPSSLFEGENLELTVNATDANGIDRVYLYKNGVQLNRNEGSAPYDFGQAGQGDTELANLAVGVYTFRAVAEDPSGNEGEATITVTVNPIPDTVNPVVSFVSPPTTLIAGEDLALTVNASDSNGISVVYLYKNGVQLNRSDSSAPFDFGQAGQNDTELANLAAGVYSFRAIAEDPSGNEGEATITVTVTAADSLKIEAEDFDVNVGFQTQATTDVGGGLNLAYATTGDYVDYNISVVSSGTYEVIFRVASATQGAKFDLKNGSTVLCNVNEPATGGSQTWVTTAPKVISLPAGNTTLRIVANGNSWNLNWFELIPLDPQALFVEAEDFDVNVGFQTQNTSDIGGGLNLGFTNTGDYVDYGINLAAAGPYEVIFRVASATQGAKFDLTDGSNVFCSVNQAATGGFQTWVTTAPKGINLPAGNTNLRILATGSSWNMNWFELMPYNGGVSIEAEDFDSTVGFGTQGTTDIGGGGNLKDASTGDTATYLNVNIPVSGTYEATFRIASLNQPVRFALKNGSTTLVTVDQPATGGYQVWTSWATSSSEHIYLPAGTTTLTIESNGTGWNLNWFDLKLVAFE